MEIAESGERHEQPYFCTETPLRKQICVTRGYWEYIVTIKHPVLRGKEQDVKHTLKDPETIRRSASDPQVFLYYQRFGKYYVCAVVRHQNGKGFLITAYRTDKIKEGEHLWPSKTLK